MKLIPIIKNTNSFSIDLFFILYLNFYIYYECTRELKGVELERMGEGEGEREWNYGIEELEEIREIRGIPRELEGIR